MRWLLLLALFLPFRPDIVHLTNGRKLRGIVVDYTPKGVWLAVPKGKILIPYWQIRLIEDEPLEKYYYEEAERLFQRQMWEESYLFYQKLLPQKVAQQKMEIALLRAAFEALFQKRYKKAEELFHRLLKDFPFSLGFLGLSWLKEIELRFSQVLEEGKQALLEKKAHLAKEKFQTALLLKPAEFSKVFPYLSQVHLLMAKRAFEKKQYKQCQVHLFKALVYDPEMAGPFETLYNHLRLYLLYQQMQKKRLNLPKDFWQIPLFSPSLWRTTRSLYALWLKKNGDYPQAARLFYQILRRPYPKKGPIPLDKLARKIQEKFLTPPQLPTFSSSSSSLPSEWEKLSLPPFQVFLKASTSKALLLDFLSKSFYLFSFPFSKRKLFRPRCEIFIYPNQESFHRVFPNSNHPYGHLEITIHFGRASLVRIHTYVHSSLFRRALPHLLAEAAFIYQYPELSALPSWVREGIAQHWESPFFQKHYLLIGREKIKHRSSPLLSADPSKLSAPLSYSLVRYLWERYTFSKLKQLWRQLTKQDFATSFQKVLKIHLAVFESEWRAWLLSQNLFSTM